MTDSASKPAIDTEALRKKYLEERDKRLRRDGEQQYFEASGEFAEFAADPYVDEPLQREAIDEETDVAVIGGGFGGLLTAAALRDKGVGDFRIIEQGGDFGGTWYWNRYPGIRCDIESYIYMPLLEEVGTMPTERYARGSEIFAHCQKIGRHYDLYDRALFQTKVTRIAWDDKAVRWIVETDRGDRIRARFVSVAQGPLSKVKLPGIPGIRKFTGTMFHSSRWNYDYTGGDSHGGLTKLAGERIAVIGTGASGIQIIPRLADHAEHVYVFQRTPSVINVRDNRPTDIEWFASQPYGWQRERMQNFLSIISGLPQDKDMVGDSWTDFWKRVGKAMHAHHESGGEGPPEAVMQQVDFEKMEEIRRRVEEVIEDPATAEAAKPWYNYLCKRPLYSDEFLHVFNRDNVTLVDTGGQGVSEITESGLVAAGEEYPVDCIIFATGFDVGAAAYKVGGYELVGKGGLTLDEKWKDGVRSLHGTQICGFPNFHIVGGVNQGTTAFNFTHTLAMQAEHACDIIAQCLEDGVAAMEVTEEAERRWNAQMEAKHHDMSHFHEECTPGFLNNEGNFKDKPTFIGATYGGGPVEYEQIIREWRAQHIERDTVRSYDKAKPVAA
ncbi:NAD(P)/FAD-dependent oxidoreductase [uncultured Parasphingopyxis sp.]|uniref:flavin-containing monooxygenase n=1 Tax=uncultured Parasphingopyxis sp. TaxID=1547918 RepID=UPI00260932AF|nr:NAD(P)/FAD-dependent oxidoreductase [uncultured Parasphingopyxis sp.]